MRPAACIALLLLLFGAAAWAGLHPLDDEIEKCMNNAPSTHGMIQCASNGEKKWDAELNRAYGELAGLLPPDAKDALRTAQRTWIPWRGKEFSLLGGVYTTIYNSLDGGTMWLAADAIAQMEFVRSRALEIRALADEIQAGKPAWTSPYPGRQTDEQLRAAMEVKNESARLGKALGEKGSILAGEAHAAWEDFRNKDAAFLALFYGKRGDEGFALHRRMLRNRDRIRHLRGLYDDLKEGGLREPSSFGDGKDGKEGGLYLPSSGRSDFSAYIIDPDPRGTNVRDAPDGRIIRTLPHRPADPSVITVKVTGHRDRWLSVTLHDGAPGWIFSGLVGMSLRNYAPGAMAVLRVRPGRDAPSVGEISGDEEVTVIGGEGKWALVRNGDTGRDLLTGWLEPEKQCGSPYTTCP